jgi:hypothetical protein
MRTDLAPLPCLSCYPVSPPGAIDTWLQHWLPVLLKCIVIGTVFLFAVVVVLRQRKWLRASRQEPQAGDRDAAEEVRTGSERAGGNADAGS